MNRKDEETMGCNTDNNEYNQLELNDLFEDAMDVNSHDPTSAADDADDSRWIRMKKRILKMDVSKLDQLSDNINNATKSKTFQFGVVIIAIIIAFMCR